MAIVNFISSWLKDIVVLFILISIAELVMPKGNMKRYIDLIIGFLIIFTIMTPFAKIAKKDLNLGEAVFNYSKSRDLVGMEDEKFYLEQEKQVERLYKEKLKDEITKLVEKESLYMVKELFVDILDSEEGYGEIQYLEIVLREEKEDNKKEKIEIEKIKPVEINKKSQDIDMDYEGDYSDLEKLISVKYSIEKDKINIINYDKGNGE